MAKHMQDKESMAGITWLALLIIAGWGGLVRFLMDVKQGKAKWSWINAFAQIVVSAFTGVIGGLISIEGGLSIYMILATAGISGAMGSVALTYFWERITGVKAQRQQKRLSRGSSEKRVVMSITPLIKAGQPAGASRKPQLAHMATPVICGTCPGKQQSKSC